MPPTEAMPIEEAVAITQSRRAALRPQVEACLAGRPRVTLEIGCGHGHYLTAYAAAHPEEPCVAIDIIEDRLERAARKSERAGVNNITWLRASAEDLLAVWPAEVKLGPRIFILFPDPWPKRRHWKNRLIQAPFLEELAERTEPGAELCFRTDHAPYFLWARDVLSEHPRWKIDPAAPWPMEVETVFQARAPAYQSLMARRAARD